MTTVFIPGRFVQERKRTPRENEHDRVYSPLGLGEGVARRARSLEEERGTEPVRADQDDYRPLTDVFK